MISILLQTTTHAHLVTKWRVNLQMDHLFFMALCGVLLTHDYGHMP